MPTEELSNTPKLINHVDLPPEVQAEIDQYENDLREELDQILGVVRNQQGEIVGARDGLKGGASSSKDSGFFQETEHPRGPGGRFSNKPSSGVNKRVPWWMKASEGSGEKKEWSEEIKQHIMNKAKEAAKSLGYDPDLIIRNDEKKTFKIGDKMHYYGGAAYMNPLDDKAGTIEIFPHAIMPFDAGSITAHEVMHQKWNDVLTRYNREAKRIAKEANQRNQSDPYEWSKLTKLKGLAEANPVYFALRDLMNGDEYKKLISEDGITMYSGTYWDELAKPGSKLNYQDAFHETLAEIARLDFKGKAEGKGPIVDRMIRLKEGPWGKLYNTVNELYASMNK